MYVLLFLMFSEPSQAARSSIQIEPYGVFFFFCFLFRDGYLFDLLLCTKNRDKIPLYCLDEVRIPRFEIISNLSVVRQFDATGGVDLRSIELVRVP
jgi:hypothetical protein